MDQSARTFRCSQPTGVVVAPYRRRAAMLGASGRFLVILALATALTSEHASARTVRCRERVLTNRTDRAGRGPVSCEVEGRCDGLCAFEVPVCSAATCPTEELVVPVGRTRRERVALQAGDQPTKLVLRCRPAPRGIPCPSSTTM